MEKNKLPILDIYLASFLSLQGIHVHLLKQGSRIIFELPTSDEVYRLTNEYNRNCPIPVLDFISAVRRLRAQMLSMKCEQ